MNWFERNQVQLNRALQGVRQRLECKEHPSNNGDEEWCAGEPSALETLCAAFGLTSFEQQVLVLCAGVEMEGAFAELCATAQGGRGKPFVTFGLALACLKEPHWSALTPAAPLRRWKLIELRSPESLTQSPLKIDEKILHYLAGIHHLDERLAPLLRAVEEREALTPSFEATAQNLGEQIEEVMRSGSGRVMQLFGTDTIARRSIATRAFALARVRSYLAHASTWPMEPQAAELLETLWERETILSTSGLLVEWDGEAAGRQPLVRLLENTSAPVCLLTSQPNRAVPGPVVLVETPAFSREEYRSWWRRALPAAGADLDPVIDQFQLDQASMQAAAQEAAEAGSDVGLALWRACRKHARTSVDKLAERLEPSVKWDDLVLPAREKRILRDITAHARWRWRVYDEWGFRDKLGRGLGISAVFAGESGTGKTMAAEALAADLKLDLLRIDLSQVVSKYIGETEKSLSRLFDAAESGGAILLFDEADALFGKRSEVRDSHDRYANIEVSYLLQRMESYRGLAILTTNLKQAIDPAFLRRIRFIVRFPFPDLVHRREIWQRVFPEEMPRADLHYEQLAQLNVPGGNIRNIALHAAFLAADAGLPVGMGHVLRAARLEYEKLERNLSPTELEGWVN